MLDLLAELAGLNVESPNLWCLKPMETYQLNNLKLLSVLDIKSVFLWAGVLTLKSVLRDTSLPP